MQPSERQKQIPAPADVIDLDSSDSEDGGPAAAAGVSRANRTGNGKQSNNAKSLTKPLTETQTAVRINSGDASSANYQPLENRSFWRAGAYEIGPTLSTLEQGDLEHARVHPRFLHSNATSHKWAFGAIAELLDNAVDEIGNGATFVRVDRVYNTKDNSPALLFQDDGGGMDPESMRKCMSLGYSSKTSNKTIGQYGNGFKTSTMRLGADVIVFSRASRSGRATQSIGLLSYTFLRRTRQDDVIVPMIDFDTSDSWAEPIVFSSKDDWSSNLKTIIQWSPFASKDDLMQQFDDIGSHGTKIIVYNLWMNDEGIYELNFDDDEEDIRLRDEANQGNASKATKKTLELQSHLSYRMRFSLRAYASILYLKKFTNFKIILRGKPVEQFSIADDLKHSKTIKYSPQVGQGLKEVTTETIIGFIKEAPALGVCGFNVYHKNRLIRPYWKVTADGSSKGYGVVGVLEANFIEPAHDKQDFERSTIFNKLELRLKQMVMEYWKGNCHLVGHLPEGTRRSDIPNKLPTQIQANRNIYEINFNNKSANVQSTLSPDAASHPETSPDDRSLDQICEENIQLFMRCNEYKLMQAEKIQKIEQLEKELEETKNKCARLSYDLELQKKHRIVTHR
ncbi:Histidine kinase-- DNA gyrase B-- and HSP90-like ATPase family protein [Striga hermonthica]|uniref:Histidine kinase-- DNA gyrase B-- and HSP90-like ATPase family protein n=1 Tax=Striga hermonthica TaxID=68872 RepID=A0A9N7RS47_STRHE|nr:Histidine kinase-- DNA gyrase B-- and HSP90-like ATPase family protein [Striga hermonthica]